METQNSKKAHLINLTIKICQATAEKDLRFIKENVADKIKIQDSFLGEKNKELIDNNKLLEDKYRWFFPKPSYEEARAKVIFNRGKVVYENWAHLHLRDVTKFSDVFFRTSFYYSYSQNKWKLIKVSTKISWFSKYQIPLSIWHLKLWIENHRSSESKNKKRNV